MGTKSRTGQDRAGTGRDDAPNAVGDKPVRAARNGLGEVPFRTQRLEPRLLWAIAALAMWMAVVLMPAEPAAWLLAVFAAALGGWSRAVPPQQARFMFARAALLLLGGLFLQVSVGAGANGPAFAWPVLVITAYSLLLPRRWCFLLWALAAIEFVAARLLDGAVESWQAPLAQSAVLIAFAYVAQAYGRSAREMDAEIERARRDSSSHLYNETGFFANGAQLFDEARRRKRPFAMVLLNSADLREVAGLAGKKAANQLFAELVQSVHAATPPEGLAARTDAVEFGMALPGFTAARAASLVHQTLGQPPFVEVTLKGTRLKVMLDAVIAEATPDVNTLEDMYDRLRGKLLQRAGMEPTTPAELHSTLGGWLEADSVIPRNARPTMPMQFPQP